MTDHSELRRKAEVVKAKMYNGDISHLAAFMQEYYDEANPFTILSLLDEIEKLRAEVLQCALELSEAAHCLRPELPRLATIFDAASNRARKAMEEKP